MKPASKLFLSLLAFALGALASPAFGQVPANSQIKAEITRLQQSAKAAPISDKDFVEIASSAGDLLQAATAAFDSGKIYLSLEKLGQAEDLLQAARRGADKTAVEKGGLPAFESEWGKVSLRLTALDKEAHAGEWKNVPLAIRALTEAAARRAIPLLEGGRGFATANGPKDGLLYVGEAEGNADFAAFCLSLNLAAQPLAFSPRSLLPELQTLQQKTNAAFQPPKSIDLHPRFIALNSAIKLAQELDASRFYAGALFSYLEGVRHYGMLDAPPLDAAQQVTLQQDLAIERKKIAAASSDESIAQLFLERAESYSAHADGSTPSADEWRGARVILDQVLPAYYATQKPAAQIQQVSGKTVDITLVRWPYT